MEAELTKVRDLLDMGFIQPQEGEERMAEIRQRYGVSASSAGTSSSSSTSSPTTTNSYESNQSYSYSPPAPEPAPASYNQSAFISQAPISAPIASPGAGSYSTSGLEWDTSVTVKSAELTLENNNLTVINRGKATGSYNIVRAKTGFSSGRHSWSIRIDSVPAGQGWVFAIGITRGDVNKSMYVGGGGNGWAYLSNGQKLFSNAFLKYETKGFGAGDVIGVTVDFDASELRFSRNGEDLGLGFKGISGFVYPAVTVPGPDKGPLSKQFGSLTLL